MNKEIRWVIVGSRGLYTGQYLLKRDAIKDHVTALYGQFRINRDGVNNLWSLCKKKGDRVTKAEISYE